MWKIIIFISGPSVKQQKWLVPWSIDTTTVSTSTWHFSRAEHGKLINKVGIRIFTKFPVLIVKKQVLSHKLVCYCRGFTNRSWNRSFLIWLQGFGQFFSFKKFCDRRICKKLVIMCLEFLHHRKFMFQFACHFCNEALGSPIIQYNFFPEELTYGKYLKAVLRKRVRKEPFKYRVFQLEVQ